MNGGEAAQLNEQVCKLLEQTSDFGELLIDTCGIKAEKMLIPKIAGEEFERNSERIWRLLESGEVLSIGVHGMGGVGKSTLVKGIYNRLRETYGEHSVFWVTVSQEFTIKSLQDKIARILGVDLLDEDNEDKRAGRVHGALSEMKNAVLILDDVWTHIDLLKVGYDPLYVECCRVIITTRSLEVCRQIGCQKVIEVHTLGEEEAWNLFHETFILGNEIILGPEVEWIAKDVAKLCDGFPLGIVTLAASMRGKENIYEWRDVLVELKKSFADQEGMREGKVFQVLKYSFDQLHGNHPSQRKGFNSLQLCFLYLSLYPEDREGNQEELIREFISEGLLETRKGRRAQFDRGRVILDKLVNVCLFERGHYGGVKMHDLVRGMALKVCEGKYMVRAGEKSLMEIPKEEKWTEDLEKVSLMNNGIRRIEEGTSPNCPNLSTLLLPYNPLEFIPNSFFCKLQGLCTLDLRETSITELPNSLSDLKSLKALLLQDCEELEYVPYLGNMKALRELDLSHTAIKEVPQGVEELLNLRFLSMNAYNLKKVPYLGNLKALRELNLSHTAIKEVPQGVEELLNLRFLSLDGADELKVLPSGLLRKLGSLQHVRLPHHLEASIEVLPSGCNEMRKLGLPVSGFPNLEEILIEWCEELEEIFEDEGRGESVILPKLRRLKLIVLPRLKSAFRRTMICNSIEEIRTEPCQRLMNLGLPVWGFPNLEEIVITSCGEIKEIFEDEGMGESVTLPKLKRLDLYGLFRLESVCRRTMICNSIEEITILKCPRLMKLPLHLDVPPPPTLRRIEVQPKWWESLEWDNPDLPHLLQPLLSFSLW